MAAKFGFFIGLLFGALMNLWFWPFLSPAGTDPAQVWVPGSGLIAALERYFAFYLATSLWFDVPRAIGNLVLLALLSPPLLKLLRRFHQRFGLHEAPSPALPNAVEPALELSQVTQETEHDVAGEPVGVGSR